MESKPELIQGGKHSDQRGQLTFFNTFDMSKIKRFYSIQNIDTEMIRAWRGHKIEQRWFYPVQGKFVIRTVKIDDFSAPDNNLPITDYTISVDDCQVLHVPVGYATSIQAVVENSKLMVFADYGIENATLDDYLYPQDYFLK